jgi:hypothetical protein
VGVDDLHPGVVDPYRSGHHPQVAGDLRELQVNLWGHLRIAGGEGAKGAFYRFDRIG